MVSELIFIFVPAGTWRDERLEPAGSFDRHVPLAVELMLWAVGGAGVSAALVQRWRAAGLDRIEAVSSATIATRSEVRPHLRALACPVPGSRRCCRLCWLCRR